MYNVSNRLHNADKATLRLRNRWLFDLATFDRNTDVTTFALYSDVIWNVLAIAKMKNKDSIKVDLRVDISCRRKFTVVLEFQMCFFRFPLSKIETNFGNLRLGRQSMMNVAFGK